jgi:hypothetical protein
MCGHRSGRVAGHALMYLPYNSEVSLGSCQCRWLQPCSNTDLLFIVVPSYSFISMHACVLQRSLSRAVSIASCPKATIPSFPSLVPYLAIVGDTDARRKVMPKRLHSKTCVPGRKRRASTGIHHTDTPRVSKAP